MLTLIQISVMMLTLRQRHTLILYPVVDCGELSNPDNGLVTYTSTVYQSQAVYSCNSGYELSTTGSTLRICRATGQWTSFPPQCNRKPEK